MALPSPASPRGPRPSASKKGRHLYSPSTSRDANVVACAAVPVQVWLSSALPRAVMRHCVRSRHCVACPLGFAMPVCLIFFFPPRPSFTSCSFSSCSRLLLCPSRWVCRGAFRGATLGSHRASQLSAPLTGPIAMCTPLADTLGPARPARPQVDDVRRVRVRPRVALVAAYFVAGQRRQARGVPSRVAS